MKRASFSRCLLAIVLLLLTYPVIVAAERRTALVIGNAAYGEVGVLRNPVNDATDMDAALRQLGFEVTLLRDAGLRAMQEAIETFIRQLRQGGAGLFYFAGHGMQVNGENYLIPLRARINREQDTPYEAVPVGRILGGMEDANNQLNIIILDACRDNPYARQWRSAQRGLAVVQAARGSLIAYATSPGAVAIDGSGRNGVYTSYLLKHLSTSGLSVEHLFKKTRAGVVEATKGKQTPWESSSLVGDFFFVAPTTASAPTASGPISSPVPAVSGPASPDPEATMWTMVEKSPHPEDVKAFLNAYPNSRFAPVAQLRLQQLQRLTGQQRAEEDKRTAEQERQRREREAAEAQQRAEAQRREEERKRVEEVKRREEQAKKATPGTTASPPQVARLEPESKLREGASVAVPATTISGRGSTVFGSAENWSKKVRAFRMDLQPVSNREFLDFVKFSPQWKKSQISKSLHDGDYLKYWPSDESINPDDMDRPVRYVSYFAAEAYCSAKGKKVPWLNHYRTATNYKGVPDSSVSYEISYKVPEFNFVHTEWTNSWWTDTPDPGKRIKYQYGTPHSGDPHNRYYTSEEDKRHTGRSLGFRCAEY